MLLAYKYRIYPTKEDRILLAKHFGCCRFLYNHFLAYRQSEYQKGNKVSYYMTQKELTKMKALDEYSWLNEVASQTLQMAIQQLDDAYKRFFRQQGGYPKFKSKHDSTQSCSFPQRVMLEGNRVFLPKFMKNGIKVNKHIADVAWGELRRQLEYKSERKGKILIKVDRWLPSSQTCSSCLSPTGKKPLNIRKFTCPVCGVTHDRDNNAAKVIEYYGLLIFFTLGYEHNLSAGTVDYTRGGPSGGDGDSITIVAPSSYGSVKREARTYKVRVVHQKLSRNLNKAKPNTIISFLFLTN